jgi:hypothetical protein
MGQTLDKDKVQKIVQEELEQIFEHYDLDIQEVQIDIDGSKVNVTFGLHTAGDDYIGILLD